MSSAPGPDAAAKIGTTQGVDDQPCWDDAFFFGDDMVVMAKRVVLRCNLSVQRSQVAIAHTVSDVSQIQLQEYVNPPPPPAAAAP